MTQPPSRKKFGPLEAALTAFGLFSLGSGIVNGEEMQLFWGGIILVGMVILMLLRRKDWNAHWQEMEERSRRQPGQTRRSDPPTEP